MQLGMVGLGRMGANMVRRLMKAGHECVVYDLNVDAVDGLAGEGAIGAHSVEEFVKCLAAPRNVWMMVPAGVTGKTIDSLASQLESGDTLIDGGNSYYRDDIDRADALRAKSLHYVDAGTSGGVWGLERGFCLMIGGEDEAVERLVPIFESLAPGPGDVGRTPGRTGAFSPSEQGWLHCGPNGAGHFVKMVHNGIEYAVMGAYAEGLNILNNANVGAKAARMMPRPRRFAIRSTTNTTSTFRRSPRFGGAEASSRRGCSISPRKRFTRTHSSASSKGGSLTRARVAGQASPRSTKVSRRRCSPRRCTRALVRRARRSSPTRSSPRSARPSADTRRKRGDS